MLREKGFIHIAQVGDFAVRPCGEFFGVNATAPMKAYNRKSHTIVRRVGFNQSTTRDRRDACRQTNNAGLSCGRQKLSAGNAAHLTHLQKVLLARSL
jgi:hypothetical protein